LSVRPRPASQMLRPYGARIAVRELLDREPEQTQDSDTDRIPMSSNGHDDGSRVGSGERR
jgi:hypothetical protein